MLKKFKIKKSQIIFLLCLITVINVNLYAVSDESKYVTFINYSYSKEELKKIDFDTIYLASSSPTSESIGSLGAHAYVVLVKGDDFNNAFAINYYAYHESLSTLGKIAKGATVGLTGYLDIRLFADIAQRYTIGQNRTIFLYKTNIKKEKINTLIDYFYEIKDSKLKYQFFNYNCSSLLGDVFASLLNDENKSYYFPHYIMPASLINLFKKYDLVVEEYTISPPLVKLFYDNTNLSKDEILDLYTYFKVFNRETTKYDGFKDFSVTLDNFESNTLFSEKVSKIGLGIINNNLSLNFSIFDNSITEQRQSAISLYSFKFLNTQLSYDNGIKINGLTIVEKESLIKSNLLKLRLSDYYSLKLNKNNSNLDFDVGFGLSFGTLKALFSIIPTVNTNLEDLVLTLIIKSHFLYNINKAYVFLDLYYPIYNVKQYNNEYLNLSLGYRYNEELLFEASYDVLNNEYKVFVDFYFYPLFLN